MTRAERAKMIGMAHRRQRPGSGSSLQFLQTRTVQMKWPDLTDTLGELPWAVVGAVATRLYMPERATADLDLAILASDQAEAARRLSQAGYERKGDLSVGGTSWTHSSLAGLDVLELADPWAREVLLAARENRDAQGLPILPLPFLVLLKLRASRTQDLADVSRMLGLAPQAALDAVRSTIRQWALEDTEDLESLIALGHLELGGT